MPTIESAENLIKTLGRIVLVEDDTILRESTSCFLEMHGYQIKSANNGEDGIQLIIDEKPDVILCDISMPRADGFSVLHQIRNNASCSHIPFIFLTSKDDRKDLRAGMNEGADDYLTKPLDLDELIHAIESRINRNQRFNDPVRKLNQNIVKKLPHEINTPLNGIIGGADVIMELAQDPTESNLENISNIAQLIKTSGKRLSRVMENYLLYYELTLLEKDEEEVFRLRRSASDSVLGTQVIDELLTTYKRKEDVYCCIEGAAIGIHEFYWKRLMQELVDNALKYSEKGQLIDVLGRVSGNLFQLTILDHGRGFKDGDLKEIGPFIQFGRKEFEQQGLGLGLPIVQLITQLHGGKITIESTPDCGTTINLSIPLFEED